jgi:DNA modification methylase
MAIAVQKKTTARKVQYSVISRGNFAGTELRDESLRYQLRLAIAEPVKLLRQKRALRIEETLSGLLTRDLAFQGQKTAYASHNIHAFAAKFPPQLPRLFIQELTLPGESVLDPMVGSGTTLVEAVLADRCGIGFDLDPLATLVSMVKTRPINLSRCVQVGATVLTEAKRNFQDVSDKQLLRFYNQEAVQFFRYWFEERTISELFALVQAISRVPESEIKDFLQVVFSSCIITKSGALTRARDLAHSRPHRDMTRRRTQNALDVFAVRLSAAVESLDEIVNAPGSACVKRGDARALPLDSNSVDLIVTSPPYAANAIDYMRAHKFSLIWLGYEPKALSTLRSSYIGSELQPLAMNVASDTGRRIILSFAEKDVRRAAVIAHYYREMEIALREMLRVLKPGKAAILVVGSSNIKGVEIKVPTVLTEIAASVGFHVVGLAKREILRNARMMPTSHNSSRNGIEARMHEEGVIGLVKPEE